MHSKRGQIVIFIVIGLIVLIAASLIFTVGSNLTEKRLISAQESSTATLEVDPIQKFTQDCIELVSEEGIIIVGKQGGYYKLTDNYLKTKRVNISYHYILGNKLTPPKSTVEHEIRAYIEENIESCINGFENFKSKGIDIKYEFSNTNAKINQENIEIFSETKLEISRDNSKTKLPFVKLTIPVRLGYILTVSEILAHLEAKEPEWLNLPLMNNHDLQIDILSHNSTNNVYYIQDGKSKIREQPYIFMFANKLT
jgi:hypothetical protein